MPISKPTSTAQRLVWLSLNCTAFRLEMLGPQGVSFIEAQIGNMCPRRIRFTAEDLDHAVFTLFVEFWPVHERLMGAVNA